MQLDSLYTLTARFNHEAPQKFGRSGELLLPSPAQSFLFTSPVGLMVLFYCVTTRQPRTSCYRIRINVKIHVTELIKVLKILVLKLSSQARRASQNRHSPTKQLQQNLLWNLPVSQWFPPLPRGHWQRCWPGRLGSAASNVQEPPTPQSSRHGVVSAARRLSVVCPSLAVLPGTFCSRFGLWVVRNCTFFSTSSALGENRTLFPLTSPEVSSSAEKDASFWYSMSSSSSTIVSIVVFISRNKKRWLLERSQDCAEG